MNTFIRQSLLVAVVLLGCARPTPAATNAATVFAENRTFTSYLTSGSARDHVVQISVVCLAAALFIMMKKFVPDAPHNRAMKNRAADVSPDYPPQSHKE
jgi:hypothetical protein